MVAALGTFWPKLDDKFRFIVPAKARPQLAGGTYLTAGIGAECLFLFSESQFEAHSAQMELQAPPGMPASAFDRLFEGSVETQEMDKQGRLSIPAELRQYAHLERDLAVVALRRRLEIWDVATWRAYKATYQDSYSSLTEGVR